jgi:regulatory protein
MSFAQLSLKGRALRLLGTREHSRAELENKLRQFEEVPGTLAAVLDELQAKGLINEQRVLESLLHRRAGKLGAARIRQELLGKGLSPDAVSTALAGLQGNEFERAVQVWQKKFGATPGDAAAAARQTRFLASRGFAASIIRRVVTGASDDSSG